MNVGNRKKEERRLSKGSLKISYKQEKTKEHRGKKNRQGRKRKTGAASERGKQKREERERKGQNRVKYVKGGTENKGKDREKTGMSK